QSVNRPARAVRPRDGRNAPGGGDGLLRRGRSLHNGLRLSRQRQRAGLVVHLPVRLGDRARGARAVPGPRGEEPQSGADRGDGAGLVRAGVGARGERTATTMLGIAPVTDGSTAFVLFTVVMVG